MSEEYRKVGDVFDELTRSIVEAARSGEAKGSKIDSPVRGGGAPTEIGGSAELAKKIDLNKNDSKEESREDEGQLTVDVFQDDDNFYVQSVIAGVSPDDIDVHVTGESVSIRGRRRRPNISDSADFLYRECFWGAFSRSVTLPDSVVSKLVSADLKDGVLTVTLPKDRGGDSDRISIAVDSAG